MEKEPCRVPDMNRLNELFNIELEAGRLKGAAIHVEQHGKTLFDAVYGTDRPDSIYKIYSMTKPITAVAVMILVERGLISILEPVSNYLPFFKDMTVSTPEGIVPAKNPVLIKDLLNMTSGIVYPGECNEPERIMAQKQQEMLARIAAGEKLDTMKICEVLASVPLEFEPGTEWRYGASADMLGALVEQVSGMKYSAFLKKEIFEPLEMTDTGFRVPSEKMPRLAQMYTRDKTTLICSPASKEQLAWLRMTDPTAEPYIEEGGGGLYCTMKDYTHFTRMLLNKGTYQGSKGTVRILGRKTVEYLSMNNLTDKVDQKRIFESIYGYGYGNLMRTMISLPEAGSNGSIGEYGWDGLPGCYFMVDPAEDLMLVYMQQITEGADNVLRRKYRQIVYAALD